MAGTYPDFGRILQLGSTQIGATKAVGTVMSPLPIFAGRASIKVDITLAPGSPLIGAGNGLLFTLEADYSPLFTFPAKLLLICNDSMNGSGVSSDQVLTLAAAGTLSVILLTTNAIGMASKGGLRLTAISNNAAVHGAAGDTVTANGIVIP